MDKSSQHPCLRGCKRSCTGGIVIWDVKMTHRLLDIGQVKTPQQMIVPGWVAQHPVYSMQQTDLQPGNNKGEAVLLGSHVCDTETDG